MTKRSKKKDKNNASKNDYNDKKKDSFAHLKPKRKNKNESNQELTKKTWTEATETLEAEIWTREALVQAPGIGTEDLQRDTEADLQRDTEVVLPIDTDGLAIHPIAEEVEETLLQETVGTAGVLEARENPFPDLGKEMFVATDEEDLPSSLLPVRTLLARDRDPDRTPAHRLLLVRNPEVLLARLPTEREANLRSKKKLARNRPKSCLL